MKIEIKLPELGENITSGDVVNVLVHEGQEIAANQGLLELETDKAVVEIPCPHAGKVAKIHVKKSDTVKVGQTILTIEAEAAAAPQVKAAAAAPASSPPAAAPAPAPASPPKPKETAPAPIVEERTVPPGGPIPAGPATRRIARELGVDLRRVRGTGQRGQITPEDVRGAVIVMPAVAGVANAPAVEPVVPPGEPGQDAWGPIRREKMSQIRRTIAAHMVRSAGAIPHVTNFDDADITDLESLRKGVPQGYFGDNLKLSNTPLVIKAVALALRRHPALNASLDEANQQVVYKEYVHLGIAVDTPRGLVVPVIRNVDRLTIAELVRALASVAERARSVQFGIDDLRGGTFTISNLGAVGGSYSTPIINYPEAALLLLGRSRWMPMVRDGQIVPRLMLPLSLSYDHRLVDGTTAGRFLNEVIDYLQSPGKLLLAT